ncbi:histidine kinase [Dyadobacter endophyticus]|uniref:Histidine kinase n=2 Tax=Spirosomataceae TaxID=2896860 RepID=A0ABQ1YEJ7_9BACT|nr:sensor histidine kinase [Dyadobacter endophyticus]GGH21617.1 histidine kinase [Dyadobacter endophyticus]
MEPANGLSVRDKYMELLIAGRYGIYRHLILAFMLGAFVLSMEPGGGNTSGDLIKLRFFIFFMSLLYANMYLLVPHFLFKNKPVQFIAAIALFITIAYPLVFFNYKASGFSTTPYWGVAKYVFISLVWVAASAAIKLFQRWLIDSQRISELEHLTKSAELEQLKNQINPHFLFNMLNNVNVLTQKDPEKASQILEKLSGFLRYQLYDSARPRVLLTSEIRFIQDLLNMEKIRRDNFEFTISNEGVLTGIQVAPLLFMTFVENAVKHSLDADNGSWIHIYFGIHEDELNFKCINSKPQLMAILQGPGGLGLGNVRRRLALLYPERHIIKAEDSAQSYSLSLTVKL